MVFESIWFYWLLNLVLAYFGLHFIILFILNYRLNNVRKIKSLFIFGVLMWLVPLWYIDLFVMYCLVEKVFREIEILAGTHMFRLVSSFYSMWCLQKCNSILFNFVKSTIVLFRFSLKYCLYLLTIINIFGWGFPLSLSIGKLITTAVLSPSAPYVSTNIFLVTSYVIDPCSLQ